MYSPYPKTVKLRDGRSVEIRPLCREDYESLHDFLLSLSDEDRLFLRHDVRDPDLPRRWAEDLTSNRLVLLAAFDQDRVVGTGRLYRMNHGWMHHVGHLRLITAVSHRRVGLGGLLALYVFMSDSLQALLQGRLDWTTLRPEPFKWPLFLIALALMALPSLMATWQGKSPESKDRPGRRGVE